MSHWTWFPKKSVIRQYYQIPLSKTLTFLKLHAVLDHTVTSAVVKP